MADTKQKMGAKVAGMVATLAAAWLAQKLIDSSWTKVTGHKPPAPEDESDSRFGEIAAAAIISGAVIAFSRVLAQRGAAKLIA